MTETAAPSSPATPPPATPPLFRLVEVRRAWWPVAFPGVTEEGEVIDNRIELRFRLVGEDAVAALVGKAESVGAAADEQGVPFTVAAAQVLALFVEDWRGIAAENGEPLPFGQEAFARLLSVPNVFAAVLAAYGACRRAERGQRAGN